MRPKANKPEPVEIEDHLRTDEQPEGGPVGKLRGGESLTRGMEIIRDRVKTLPNQPGVYRMINQRGDVLYVGKARDLKKRVMTYAQPYRLAMRLQRMVSETVAMEFVATHTEVEAL